MSWKASIVEGLRQRNQRERDAFVEVFQHYSTALQQSEQDQRRLFKMEQEIRAMRQAALMSSSSSPSMAQLRASSMGPSEKGGLSPSSASLDVHHNHNAIIQEQQNKIMTLQAELTSVYRLKSENNQAMLRYKERAEQDEAAVLKAEADLLACQQQLKESRTQQEKEAARGEQFVHTIEMMGQEIKQCRLELEGQHTRCDELKTDNSRYIEKIMELRAMQADKMNAMNDMYQTVTQAQRKAEQQQQQRDRKISSMDLTDSNSILDNVAWSNFFNVSIPTKKSRVLKAHRGSCTSIAYSPKGTMLASGGADSIVRIWDSRNFTACATLKGSRGGIMKVAFSPDNEFLAAVGNDKCGYVWAMRNSKLVNTFTGHLNKVYACAFSSDSDKLITGSHDRTLRIWDVHSQKFEVKSCVSACNNLAVSPNGDLLATGHMDRHVRFWSQNTYEMIHDLGEIHYQQVTSVSFSTDGGTVLTCSRDNTVKLVDTRTWKVLKTYTGTVKQEFVNGCNWNTCCFSPDGQYVLAGSSDGSVFVWNADSAEIETVLVSDEEGALEAKRARSSSDAARERQSLNPFTITGSVWNSNGKQFATCANDGKVTFWGS